MLNIHRISCALLGAFLLFTSYSPALAKADITSNLVGHWKLDETSGSTIVDSAGSANGTWSDGSGNDVAEETGKAVISRGLTFDGVEDYIDL